MKCAHFSPSQEKIKKSKMSEVDNDRKLNCQKMTLNFFVTIKGKIIYMSQMLYAGQSAQEDVPFLSDF